MSENQEHFERQMNFILDQQAKFSSDLIEFDARFQAQIAELTNKMNGLTDVVFSLARLVRHHDEQIEALIQHGKEVDVKMAELAEQSKETEARLTILIDITNRLITGGKQLPSE